MLVLVLYEINNRLLLKVNQVLFIYFFNNCFLFDFSEILINFSEDRTICKLNF